jgi:hypothetical protein
MQIQLKQAEIESALRDYVTKQGINLQWRTVEIEFTSGRKDNGITADLRISDLAASIPDFPSDEDQPAIKIALVKDIADTEDTLVSDTSAESNVTSAKLEGIASTSLFGPK